MGMEYYVFYPDKRVEVHETWPEGIPGGTVMYQPSDKITPWFKCNESGYGGVAINYKYDVPNWVKAYALLID